MSIRILLIDPSHGAAGDMIIGALLDCGSDRRSVITAMQSVVREPEITCVTRAGIRALHVQTHATLSHRTLSDIFERVEGASESLSPHVIEMAKRVFERIATAEERVHGSPTYFHEVGADDAIADVIGACTALESLNVQAVVVLPLALGSGTCSGSHGLLPVPTPATVAILAGSGLTVSYGGGEGELCTPTGAALLAEFFSPPQGDWKTHQIISTGYGAGTRDPPGVPNLLRAMIIEVSEDEPVPADTVDILETTVDDISGEVIASAISRLIDAGARDASAIPVIMKKGRPGFLVRVISARESELMAELMARELGTLGVRCLPAIHRFVARRSLEYISVTYRGKTKRVPVKVGWIGKSCYHLKPEFDPAQEWAKELGIPVRELLTVIERSARAQLPNLTPE